MVDKQDSGLLDVEWVTALEHTCSEKLDLVVEETFAELGFLLFLELARFLVDFFPFNFDLLHAFLTSVVANGGSSPRCSDEAATKLLLSTFDEDDKLPKVFVFCRLTSSVLCL